MPKQAAKTRMIHARVDPQLQKSAARVFSRIGISTAEAIRLFLTQVVLHKGMPFPIAIPSAQTVAAMREANDPAALKRFGTFRELCHKI
jgi:DNA-damage-inducible protein J